jgi:hypothetical protein
MSNQYIKAEEDGRDKPAGANQFTTGKRKGHDQATKDKIRAEVAAGFLEQVLDNQDADNSTKVAAAKALLPYGKSTYSSIEERQISEWDQKSPEDIRDMVRALITAHPELLDEFKPGVRPVEHVQPQQYDSECGATSPITHSASVDKAA